MRTKLIMGLAGALLAGSIVQSNAMPMFARKYNMPCETCHAPVPKLNKTGYNFRAAGYRMPGDIGKAETEYNWTNYVAARATTDIVPFRSSRNPNLAGSSRDFEFQGVDVFPITGSFFGNWATKVELSFTPNAGTTNTVSTASAYLRYVGGAENSFWSIRTGVMEQVEGFGGSDRPVGITAPLILGGGGGFPSQTGLEFAYTMRDTHLAASLSNGFAGGPLGVSNIAADTDNHLDWQVFANQFIGSKGAAVNAFYYNGQVGSAAPHTVFAAWAVSAQYPLLNMPAGSLDLLAGFGRGRAQVTGATAVRPLGWFVEAQAPLDPKLWVNARYDQARMDTVTGPGGAIAHAFTVGANWHLLPYFQLLGEYQHTNTSISPQPMGDQVRVRALAIF